jgi:hypothetical protein
MFVAIDRGLLGELDDGDHGNQRRVLEERHEIVRHRRQRQTQRLRGAYETKDLPLGEAERAPGLELRALNRLQSARDRSPTRTQRS